MMEVFVAFISFLSFSTAFACVALWIMQSRLEEKQAQLAQHLATLTAAFNLQSKTVQVPLPPGGPLPGDVFSPDAILDLEAIHQLDKELKFPF